MQIIRTRCRMHKILVTMCNEIHNCKKVWYEQFSSGDNLGPLSIHF